MDNLAQTFLGRFFTQEMAEEFLSILFSPTGPLAVEKISEMKFGRFPYMVMFINSDPQKNKEIKKQACIERFLHEGLGLYLFETGKEKALGGFTYAGLLCHKIWNKQHPQPGLDGKLFPDKIGLKPKSGKAHISRPSENILPTYVRDVIGKNLKTIIGKDVDWYFELLEYPDFDNFVRFVFKMGGKSVTDKVLIEAIGPMLEFYLPYPIFF